MTDKFTPGSHFVKMCEVGKKAWFFVNPKGHGTRLRIYASRFDSHEAAEAFIAKYGPENPELEFKSAAIAKAEGK